MNALVTRRVLLGATAAVGAVALPAVAAAALHASLPVEDRALIVEAAALKAFRTRELAAWAALPDGHPDDFPPFVACSQMADKVREAGEALAEKSATTATDLQAKAEAMLALFGSSTWTAQEAVTEHHALVISVLHDAARLGAAS